MTIHLPKSTTHTEAVATVMALQHFQSQGTAFDIVAPRRLWDWFIMGGFAMNDLHTTSAGQTVNFGEAERMIRKNNLFYPEALGQLILGPTKAKAPNFTVGMEASANDGAIVLAPFGMDTALPMAAWRLIVRFLRSYGKDIVLVGEPGERIDLAGFTEGEIFSSRSPQCQARLIRRASLVVGVPNGFTWTAAAGTAPVLILMPDDIKPGKLFPFNAADKPFRIVAYPREGLEYASLIVGLRSLIQSL